MHAPTTAVLVFATALTAAASCERAPTHEYALEGQILSVHPNHTQASIKHGAIPGLMGAMTMLYKAEDSSQFEELQPGDLITATLVVVSNDAYLRDVRQTGAAPLSNDATRSGDPAFIPEPVAPGTAVPLTPFIDQDGHIRDFASFLGAPAILTFVYTRCPSPTFCPLMERHFATIQARTAADPDLRGLQLVSVSIDPEFDTPLVLKQHAAALGADPSRWTFLTGTPSDINDFSRQFGVIAAPASGNEVELSHSLGTVVIDAEGTVVKVYQGNDWTPDDVLSDLRRLD